MLPIGPRLAVERISGETILQSGIVLLAPDMRDALVGRVTAAGSPHEHGAPLEVKPGDKIVYSSRVDSFEIDGGFVDVVEENSVIGIV